MISLTLYLPPVMNMCNLLLQSIRRYQRNNQQKNWCSLRAEKVIAYSEVSWYDIKFSLHVRESQWMKTTEGWMLILTCSGLDYTRTNSSWFCESASFSYKEGTDFIIQKLIVSGWHPKRHWISLDTYAFDCKNIKCRIGESCLR